jgi:hypothetical protein
MWSVAFGSLAIFLLLVIGILVIGILVIGYFRLGGGIEIGGVLWRLRQILSAAPRSALQVCSLAHKVRL